VCRCLQVLRRLPPGGTDSHWAHLYFSCFSDCSLRRPTAGSRIWQTRHRRGVSREAAEGRPGRMPCLPRRWQDRSCLEAGSHPTAQAAGVRKAATGAHVPFLPVRFQMTEWIPSKRKRTGGRYAKVRNEVK